MHSSQMYTPGPATSFLHRSLLLPQNEQWSLARLGPLRWWGKRIRALSAPGGKPALSFGCLPAVAYLVVDADVERSGDGSIREPTRNGPEDLDFSTAEYPLRRAPASLQERATRHPVTERIQRAQPPVPHGRVRRAAHPLQVSRCSGLDGAADVDIRVVRSEDHHLDVLVLGADTTGCRRSAAVNDGVQEFFPVTLCIQCICIDSHDPGKIADSGRSLWDGVAPTKNRMKLYLNLPQEVGRKVLFPTSSSCASLRTRW
jgi:hypothetical protein